MPCGNSSVMMLMIFMVINDDDVVIACWEMSCVLSGM